MKQKGIVVRELGGSIIFDLSAMGMEGYTQGSFPVAKPATSTVIEEKASKWFIPWGQDNKMPNELVSTIETCGILNGIINSQSRFALGEGTIWALVRRDEEGKRIVEEIVADSEILDFMEMNNSYHQEFGWMNDLLGIGQGMARYTTNGAGTKITGFQRDDITEMRYAPMNASGVRRGRFDTVYLSAEWDKVKNDKEKRVVAVRHIDEYRSFERLTELAKGGAKEFGLVFKSPTWLKKYYSVPLWYAAKLWVEIAKKVPLMKAALFNHNFRPRYRVVIYPSFWENRYTGNGEGNKSWEEYTDKERDDRRNEIYDEIESYLIGPDNHGKAIFTDGIVDPATGKIYSEIEIIPIEDPIKDGNMLPDSAAANSEISFSMRYAPAILGASLPSGPYTNSQGGSSIREATAMQISTLEPERMHVRRNYKLISKFNNWDQLYGKKGLTLEPIIMSTVLTTLDTGAGSKSVMLGADPGTDPTVVKPPKET